MFGILTFHITIQTNGYLVVNIPKNYTVGLVYYFHMNLIFGRSMAEFHKGSIHELWLYLKSTDLSDSLSQITKLASLILTIPATSAGAERSFSALKRIKTHLRNSQSQNRLSALSLLSIEKKMLTTVQKQNSFYDDVLEDFTKKPRRIDLLFK
jgi:hypothetical protein